MALPSEFGPSPEFPGCLTTAPPERLSHPAWESMLEEDLLTNRRHSCISTFSLAHSLRQFNWSDQSTDQLNHKVHNCTVLLFLLLCFAFVCSQLFASFTFVVPARCLEFSAIMGNCYSLCSYKHQTDQEDPKYSITMAKEVVYQTSPFDGQKPGTSGIQSLQWIVLWPKRLEKESQGVYAKELYGEFHSGGSPCLKGSDLRQFSKQFLLPE